MPVTIKDIREKYPQYDALSDVELADKLHSKYYSDLDKNDFYNRIGLQPTSLKDKVMRYGVKGIPSSLGQFGHQILNIPSHIARGMGQPAAAEELAFRPGFDYRKAVGLPEQRNLGDIAVEMTPQIMGAFALPEANLGKIGGLVSKIPKAGKYLNKILAQGLPQAGYSAALSEPEDAAKAATTAGATMAPFSVASQLAQSTSPWARRGAQLIGAGLGYEAGKLGANAIGMSPGFSDIAGLISGAIGARGMTSQKMMQDALTHGMDPALVEQRLGAARRLGLDYLTPAEAAQNPFLAGKQGALGKTEEGSHLLYKKAQNRVASEARSVNDVLNKIYNEKELGPLIKGAYEEAYKVQLPKKFTDKFKDNDVIKAAERKVENSAAYRETLKNVPRDSLKYWDHIKQAIDDTASKLLRAGKKKEAKILTDTSKNLRLDMDRYSPKYQEARSLSERKIVREGLEKIFNKNERTGTNFYKSLADEEKFNKTLHHLRTVPEAQAKLQDMRSLFKDLIGTPTVKGAAALEKTSMNKSRSTSQDIIHMLENKLTEGKFDKEMINFITDPNWDKMMKDINKISDKQKRWAKFFEYLGKATAQTSARNDSPMNQPSEQLYE